MKPPHLSITVGISIAVMVTITATLMYFQSASADSSLTIGMDRNVYGVGEPISFFVEIENENGLYPVASIVNEQNRTVWYDDDLPPNGYKGTTKVYYVEQNSENVPMINQTGKYTLIVTYGEKRASKDLTVGELVTEDNMIHFYGSYKGIDNDSGMVEIANRTYNFITIHSAPSDLIVSNDTTITFQGVSFTIPGCGKCLPVPMPFNPLQYIQVHFPDNTNETLAVRDNIWSSISGPLDSQEYFTNGTKIFPNGTKGTWHPRLHKDQIVTTFTRHTNPQAGITVLHNSVKFLVSSDNQISNQTFTGNENPPVIISQVELDSAFVILPDNQICYDKPGFSSTYTCSTSIVRGYNIQCAYFIGSSYCEPIHQRTSGTNLNCANLSTPVGTPQWFDLYNTQNETVQIQIYSLTVDRGSGFWGKEGIPTTTLTLGPHQKCTYGFYPVDEPLSLDQTNMSMVVSYMYNGKNYAAFSPPLTDIENDNRTWQFDGGKWVFAEQNTMPVPEFPVTVPILLIGITSLVGFYRIRFRN